MQVVQLSAEPIQVLHLHPQVGHKASPLSYVPKGQLHYGAAGPLFYAHRIQ